MQQPTTRSDVKIRGLYATKVPLRSNGGPSTLLVLSLRGVFRNDQWGCVLLDEHDDIIPEPFTVRPSCLPEGIL